MGSREEKRSNQTAKAVVQQMAALDKQMAAQPAQESSFMRAVWPERKAVINALLNGTKEGEALMGMLMNGVGAHVSAWENLASSAGGHESAGERWLAALRTLLLVKAQ